MDIFKNEKTIEPEFAAMLSSARACFETDNKNYKYQQCLVLTTLQGEKMIYPIHSDSVKVLIDQQCSIISESEKTTIKKIVCMWKGECVDVPSGQFLKKLCALNAENTKAEILLKAAGEAYVTKKIADIIGKFV